MNSNSLVDTSLDRPILFLGDHSRIANTIPLYIKFMFICVVSVLSHVLILYHVLNLLLYLKKSGASGSYSQHM